MFSSNSEARHPFVLVATRSNLKSSALLVLVQSFEFIEHRGSAMISI